VSGGRRPAKLVLAVIDGAKPEMLQRAIATGQAPALAEIAARGSGPHACTAAFPSVTPVCAASIATGVRQDRHHIPAMNWWSRTERRYVEYGSSFAAARRFGINRQLVDTVYNMNAEHLAADARTVFEALDAEDVRTAGTTYLMYRGLHAHGPAREFALSRIASATLFRRPVRGPRELFYADLFASRATGCWSQLGLPGMRDQHAGCVGAYLVEHDLFDFLLLSLPDNDTHSHKHGPQAQVASISAADRQLERVMHAAGGVDAFLDEHAVIVVSDHSHAPVEDEIAFADAFDGWEVMAPARTRPDRAEIAMCPSQRAAMIYVLLEEGREAALGPLVRAARELAGVDLVLWREGEQAVIGSARGELRFAPGEAVRDRRGLGWRVTGELGVLRAEVSGGEIDMPVYPDGLARVWAALTCPTSGDVLLSAAPEHEFPDWGGVAHVGGGSHGSLHRVDSEGVLLTAGVAAPAARDADGAWALLDVAPMTVGHFLAR
jgi:predicted AlkP superfamily pyrophosphatase or phosphodiesterase